MRANPRRPVGEFDAKKGIHHRTTYQHHLQPRPSGSAVRSSSRDIRDAFEQALAESGIGLPDRGLARRHALRRMAARLIDGEMTPADLATDDWWETEVETTAEQSFVALIPQCDCCIEYTLGLDQQTWAVRLRNAALALTSSPPIDPGC
ncbi:hypothetical protein [Streptomyces yangpuensis]|uniref:hypothetical protein n=2 Tax=Streptomyces yangpuensis TaxID=1648182 RepID=UPI00368DB535